MSTFSTTPKVIRKALRIPKDHAEHVAYNVWPDLDGKLHPAGRYTIYLFELYNTYCIVKESEAEDISCGRCRTKMKRIFEGFIEIWRQYGIIDE